MPHDVAASGTRGERRSGDVFEAPTRPALAALLDSEACRDGTRRPISPSWPRLTELRKARKAERQNGRRKLFPVRLVDTETVRDWECFDADGGKDRSPVHQPPLFPSATSAVELREYFIPDFSHWKEHDPFAAAFARLLKDLRAEESTK